MSPVAIVIFVLELMFRTGNGIFLIQQEMIDEVVMFYFECCTRFVELQLDPRLPLRHILLL